ncbi:MAG: diguanylate cyclase (GGDEF)-like protein/PAS domain S-box-containing protein [Glaciecola sp.]|jgi:diguanylate cyclase (GGDEF)-like protein/PAS domain S-box-containing protein
MTKKMVKSASPSDILGSDWFQGCVNYLNDAIIVTEAEPTSFPGPRILWANDVFYKLTGYQPVEIIGKSPRILQGPLTDKSVLKRLSTALENWEVCRVEVLNYKKDGTTFWNEFEVTPIKNGVGWYTHWISVQRDVSERKLAEEKVNYQSTHDELTGLVNRREFERCAEELLASLVDTNSKHAACYIDLDQFKVVNDTCGHAAGDQLLRQLGALLKKSIRKGDTLSRLGGDEFGVLIKNSSIEDSFTVASDIKSIIEDFRFIYEGKGFRVSASIGLVPIFDAETTLARLMKNADEACYLAKDHGRNRIHIYNEKDLTQRRGEVQWINRIQKALAENRFSLYAQRIEPLKDSNKPHYELLIRMQDVNGRIIPPGGFFPAAERHNLIVQVERWVIDKTFSLLHLNPSFLDNIDFISVNLSVHSLTDESVLEFILLKFRQFKIDGNKFCFEITETVAISDILMVGDFILALKKLGCKFALDDFGSALSSLGYLKTLPIDYLKIDGVLVKDIVEDKIDYAIVKAINEIAHTLGMQTVAEFVENNDIKKILIELGVDYAQGYGIHRPQPFEEILSLLSDNQSASNFIKKD